MLFKMYRINIILSLRKENIYELISNLFRVKRLLFMAIEDDFNESTEAASMMNINNIFYVLKLLIA